MGGRGFRAGLRLLTCLPTGQGQDTDAAVLKAPLWFPPIGLLLGAILFAGMQLPVGPIPRAALVTVLWAGLTGGLHEDGLHDCLDAALSPATSERRRSILKDPRVGSHALTGGVLHQLLRFAALTSTPAAATLAAPVIGRWAMASSLALGRPARAEGLAALYESRPWGRAATALTLLCLLPAAAFGSPARTAIAWVMAAATALVVGRFLTRRFDGLTGDAHGALGLLAETAALCAFLPVGGPA